MNTKKIETISINDGCIKDIILNAGYIGDSGYIYEDDGELGLAYGGEAIITFCNGKKLKIKVSEYGWINYEN